MLNLPNILTILRVIFVPVIAIIFYSPIEYAHQIAAAIFWLTAVTDFFDGYLARKWQQESKLGAFLDPVADKLCVAVTLIILLQNDPSIGIALSVAFILGREITISALREWMAEIGARAAVAVSWVGKWKTFAQMSAIFWMMMMWQMPEVLGFDIYQLAVWLLYVSAGLSLWSMVSYLRAAWPLIKE